MKNCSANPKLYPGFMMNKINRGNVINKPRIVKNRIFALASVIFIAGGWIEFWISEIAALNFFNIYQNSSTGEKSGWNRLNRWSNIVTTPQRRNKFWWNSFGFFKRINIYKPRADNCVHGTFILWGNPHWLYWVDC